MNIRADTPMHTNISHFNDLLTAARAQAEPQRLLMVFAGASLPSAATAAQRAQFEAGASGELTPLMCVDKDPHTLADFDALVREAHAMAPDWALVFAAALAGPSRLPPTQSQVDVALTRMVEALKAGDLGSLIPFDRQGQAVQLG